ncbi:hypothetical protein [Dyadobacter sp. 3J3]|uniref:hypothetical protein n=1 Tax=Dyadobacter sp. 3J3 TaxID=2606600 RepID=UPI00135BD3FD|nr:hypothetical protein [Dyadobacter sp. 3J3]
MAFRNDLKNFPFQVRDKELWYFTINWINRDKTEFCTVQGKKDLVTLLGALIQNKHEKNHQLFGVWTGEYSTDVFDIPIETGYNELSKYFVNTL